MVNVAPVAQNQQQERHRCPTPRAPKTPSRDVPGATFFTGQAPRPRRRCEEGRHRAIHGGTLRDRVMAEAVGRRGLFPQGRYAPIHRPAALEGNAPSGDAERRTRRPGMKNTRSMCLFWHLSSLPLTTTTPSGGRCGRLRCGCWRRACAWPRIGSCAPYLPTERGSPQSAPMSAPRRRGEGPGVHGR